MHISLAWVASIDGKITRGNDPDYTAWASAEDKAHFAELRDRHEVVILDSHTYGVVQPVPSPDLLRVVVTRHPERYIDATQPGQLEFIAAEPGALIDQLTKRGYTTALLASGSRMNTAFMQAGLISELYITIEPYIFGSGRPMFAPNIDLATQCVLLDSRHLNNKGTLLLHYRFSQID